MQCAACEYEGSDFKILPVPVSELQKTYSIAFCPQCGLGTTLDVKQEDIEKINEIHYGKVDDRLKVYYYTLHHHLQLRYNESLSFIKKYQPGKQLLEVGSSIGFTLNLARQKGYEVFGCEINENLNRFSQIAYEFPVFSDFFSIEKKFDVVIMNDVLEHFPEPAKALRQAAQLLNEGGVLFVQLPNSGSSRFKKLGANWEFLTPPDHTFHFTVKSLRMMGEKNGFSYLWHRTVNSIEDFPIFSLFPSGFREKIFFLLHHNPWYWPRFYPRKKDSGSLIQILLFRNESDQ